MVKAEIKDNIVVNIIVVDPKNVPDWCIDWPTITEGGIGWSWDGMKFTPPPTEEDISDAVVLGTGN